MATELVFYTNPMSRRRIVRWMLEKPGIRYSKELLELGSAMKTADYRATTSWKRYLRQSTVTRF